MGISLIRTLMLIAAVLVAPTTPAAETCLLRDAAYTAEEGYSLQFYPNGRGTSASQTNSFVVRREGHPRAIMIGSVIWNNGISRPNGRIGRYCPPDPRTEEELEACTYWQGVIYALGQERATFLPSQGEPAPRAILLPDFGRTLRYEGMFLDVHDAGDVFTLKGC